MQEKVILVHGWDPARYNSKFASGDIVAHGVGWDKSPEYIALLEERYEVHYCNLPGFCGVPEPDIPYYSLADFSHYLKEWKQQFCPSARLMIGYSFGGAVLLHYKYKYEDNTPVVLISPAIKRKQSLKSHLAHFASYIVPNSIRNALKGKYQEAASKYYRQGTPFLRATYDHIVRQDLSNLISQVSQEEFLIIFGDLDEETPWALVKDTIQRYGYDHLVIKDGPHSITKTHPKELIEAIECFDSRVGGRDKDALQNEGNR